MHPARTAGHVALALALSAAACASPADPGPVEITSAENIEARIGPSVTFLTLKVDMAESMSALFEGEVVLDDAGCLRLGSPDGPTAVWPRGYGFETGLGIRILDAGGSVVGRVGGSFRLGGGEVPSLHDGLGFTQADRDLAAAHCPGRYWIIGEDA